MGSFAKSAIKQKTELTLKQSPNSASAVPHSLVQPSAGSTDGSLLSHPIAPDTGKGRGVILPMEQTQFCSWKIMQEVINSASQNKAWS